MRRRPENATVSILQNAEKALIQRQNSEAIGLIESIQSSHLLMASLVTEIMAYRSIQIGLMGAFARGLMIDDLLISRMSPDKIDPQTLFIAHTSTEEMMEHYNFTEQLKGRLRLRNPNPFTWVVGPIYIETTKDLSLEEAKRYASVTNLYGLVLSRAAINHPVSTTQMAFIENTFVTELLLKRASELDSKTN